MTVGFLKRALTLLNLSAILLICGTAYGFWSHRGDMAGPWNAPDFVIPAKKGGSAMARIDNTTVRLGRFPKVVESTAPTEVEQRKEEIESVLAELGKIASAVVAYPPYSATRPAIIFRLNKPRDQKNPNLTVGLDEALVNRPHSDPQMRAWGYEEPANYKFVGCLKGEDGYTYFQFDMNCDGKDIQKIRWSGEVKGTPLKAAKGGTQDGIISVFKKGGGIRDLSRRRTKEGTTPETATVPTPAVTVPVPVAPGAFRGNLFDQEAGTFAPTEEGVAYLRDNFKDILKDAITATYKDKNGRARGIEIRQIKKGSVANSFGLLPNDVILQINNRPVTKQANAINVVKDELSNKKARYIEVLILRFGQRKTLRFDTRDPATRRRAKDAFRNRR